MNRRELLGGFLALPVAVRLGRYSKPLAREFELFSLTLYMAPMTKEQLTLSDEDKAFMDVFNLPYERHLSVRDQRRADARAAFSPIGRGKPGRS